MDDRNVDERKRCFVTAKKKKKKCTKPHLCQNAANAANGTAFSFAVRGCGDALAKAFVHRSRFR